jgi:hypothetical protein
MPVLKDITQASRFHRESFDACVKNQPCSTASNDHCDNGTELASNRHPSFFINGKLPQAR